MVKLNPYNSKEEVLRFENRLDDLIAYLNKHSSIRLSENVPNARLQSAVDEDKVKDELIDYCDISNIYHENGSEREFADFFMDGQPINIKISDCKTADNVSSTKALVYALTGKILNKETEQANEIERISEGEYGLFPSYMYCDYYFIVFNKREKKYIWQSCKHLSELCPNADNQPFQVKWENNYNRVNRTYEEAVKFLLEGWKHSKEKKIKKDMYVYKKINSCLEKKENELKN